ncbi:MAG: hypothetical protein QOH96_4070 [Blastocatellia bacterium]|jgi:hypothetical protein|nr:hypothetical protein [Blastocatellia bacterium]
MKIIRRLALLISLLTLITSLTGAQNKSNIAAGSEPETVVTTFHVKDGKEAEMSELIQRAWKTYNKLGMVLQQPNIIAHGTDDAGKLFYIEILSWKNQDTPDNAPAEVKAIWAEMEALCEKREGHRGIVFSEVQIDSAQPDTTRRKTARK